MKALIWAIPANGILAAFLFYKIGALATVCLFFGCFLLFVAVSGILDSHRAPLDLKHREPAE